MTVTSDKPKVSIITPSFNSVRTVRKTLESVLDQTVAPYEYIVKDGGSTDGTIQLLEDYRDRFIAKNIDFRIISSPDKGIYDAMNIGIKEASGDLIGIINSDDWLEPIAVERVTETYAKTPFDMFYADLRIWAEGEKGDLTERLVKRARYREHPAVSRDWNHPTMFVTKQMYDLYSYKCEGLHDDWELVLRMRKDGRKTVVLNETLANFRMNGVSHEKGLKKAVKRGKDRYKAYRDNGYSRLYFFECIAIELAKWIAG